MSQQKPRILWVEDESSFQDEMEEVFGKVFDISFANSSVQAQKLICLDELDYPLIIVDLYLENNKSEDGINLIRWIKEKLPWKKVIAITKDRHKYLKDAERIAGADDSFRKEELDFVDFFEAANKLLLKAKLFISYSRKDQKYLNDLSKRLKLFSNQGFIEAWEDNKLTAGEDWDERIKSELSKAHVIIFLLSPDAIASDYINDTEVRIAKERHQRGEVDIIPIVVRPCNWKPLFGRLFKIPRKIEAISLAENQDVIWLEIQEEIGKLFQSKK
mgnify:CR=1 FL=1